MIRDNIHCISSQIFENITIKWTFCVQQFFFSGQKLPPKKAIIKTKSVTIAFFSSSPFLLLALSFPPFLFLHYCDFGAYRA